MATISKVAPTEKLWAGVTAWTRFWDTERREEIIALLTPQKHCYWAETHWKIKACCRFHALAAWFMYSAILICL